MTVVISHVIVNPKFNFMEIMKAVLLHLTIGLALTSVVHILMNVVVDPIGIVGGLAVVFTCRVK